MTRPAIIMQRVGLSLRPMTDLDASAIEALPFKKGLKVKITQGRSSPSNRLYWAMLRLVADNLPGDVRDWHLHELLKLRFGVSVQFNLRTMGKVTIPGSTAFDAMPEEKWREFLPKVIDFLCEEVIPGMGKDDLMAMAREMVGEKSP